VSEPESRVTLKVGDEHQIRLAGLATAGYHWSYDVQGVPEAIEIRKGWDPTTSGQVGNSADEIFTVIARHPGQATVRFEQRRRWEERLPPVHKTLVRVKVLDEGLA
jgi:predicted secreted protein